jgi:hypothetical protein
LAFLFQRQDGMTELSRDLMVRPAGH